MNTYLEKELEFRGRNEMPRILLVAAECAPLAKTGGLADVVGTLPKALAKLDTDARIIIPYHRIIKEKYGDRTEHMFYFYVNLGWRREYVGIEKLILDGVQTYLVDSEKYFGDSIYRGGLAEGEQYSFFSRAVLDAIPNLDFTPDVIHCNDWHTAMLPMLARTQYKGGMQENLKFLLTIHNIAFQGKYGFDFVSDMLGVDGRFYTPEFMELNGCADFLKAGCVFSDRINTVSPSYAEEIKTPYYAEGLEGILNARSAQLSGIINGIDCDVFNPETDRKIAANYYVSSMNGKAVCKEELQRSMGLEVRPDVPIFATVSRMTEQKGFDLVACVLDELASRNNAQFVILGSGDVHYENFIRGAEQRWSGRVAAYIGYNDDLAHKIYAGSDFYLMPSRFEPCGLSQMIAMRYGTLPIVRETGGLRDTVMPYNQFTGEGTGFSFANYDAWEMRDIIGYALECYKKQDVMKGLIANAMNTDFSFDVSALEYAKLYISMLGDSHRIPLAVEHNASDSAFRKPLGAVPCSTEVKLSIKVISGVIRNPVLKLYCTGKGYEYPMTERGGIYEAVFCTPDSPLAARYVFRFDTADGCRWLCPDVSGYRSRILDYEAEGFRMTVFNSAHQGPDWFKNAIIYHVFSDSFAFSANRTAEKGVAKHRKLGRNAVLMSNLEDAVIPQKAEDDGTVEYFGGTFKGIADKLGYLKQLGITCLYLTSIFESGSSHRGDVADYMNPDPVLGSVKDFESLCRKADKLGIKIITDGIFSHTGADSVYFNAESRYDSLGAYQTKESPYYNWYSFSDYPDVYRCWWGIREYPEVDENNPEYQKYISNGDESVTATWMKRGLSGWRISVCDEIPDSALKPICCGIKQNNPDAVLIGEVWDDAVIKYSCGAERDYALGTSLDSVMNYPLRNAVLDFLKGRIDASGMRDFLINQKLNYPKELYYSLMNLLGSHDVKRIRNALVPDSMAAYSDEALKEAAELEKLCAVIQFSLPGVPSIYYGDEQGMCGGDVPYNRMPFRRNPSCNLEEFYRNLCSRRNTSEVLKSGDASFLSYGRDVLMILRYSADRTGEACLSVINRGSQEQSFSVRLAEIGIVSYDVKIAPYSAEMHVLKL